MTTGIEIISNKWFKSTKSKTKGTYMKKEQFNQLFADELTSFEKKLNGMDFSDILLHKVRGANEMGVGERRNQFLNEIKLELGDIEKEAIKYRNVMIHNALDLKKIDLEKVIMITNANRASFNRVFLKMLDYDGSYIDYTVAGWPEKPLYVGAGKEMGIPVITP